MDIRSFRFVMNDRSDSLEGRSGRKLPDYVSNEILRANDYFFRSDEQEGRPIIVYCGGEELCANHYDYRRLSPGYLTLEYIVSGKVKYWVNDNCYHLRSGHLIGYYPDTMNRMKNVSSEPLRKHYIGLMGSDALDLFNKSPLSALEPLDFAGADWIHALFQQLSKFGEKEDSLAIESCGMLARLLLLQITEQHKGSPSHDSIGYTTFQQCNEYLSDNFLSIQSVAQLADDMNINYVYLTRLFRRYEKESPYKKLIRLKMNYAARILRSESISVKELSSLLGYEDPLHFSRVFKRTYRISPKFFAKNSERVR